MTEWTRKKKKYTSIDEIQRYESSFLSFQGASSFMMIFGSQIIIATIFFLSKLSVTSVLNKSSDAGFIHSISYLNLTKNIHVPGFLNWSKSHYFCAKFKCRWKCMGQFLAQCQNSENKTKNSNIDTIWISPNLIWCRL